jgi:hypothetical protein
MLCRAVDVRAEIKIGYETWQLWRQAGLQTFRLGGEAEMVVTDHLFEFIASLPALPERPSKKRKAARDAKKKPSGGKG